MRSVQGGRVAKGGGGGAEEDVVEKGGARNSDQDNLGGDLMGVMDKSDLG